MEAIVLAGGFGTRLSHIVKDVPKPMAPINNIPFLQYILSDIINKGIDRIIIAVGYKKEFIIDYFGNTFMNTNIIYSIEDEPLFTGGAIKQALNFCKHKELFIINGDTYFDVDLIKMKKFHQENNSDLTIATKLMKNYNRYGTILVDENDKVTDFIEKKEMTSGLINGGIYLLNKNILDIINLKKFSFEFDFMEKKKDDIAIYSFNSNCYFIDIGIEEDYKVAQQSDIFKKGVV
ncbi:nucleotidyltransferase family protein [Peptoanaerobacter stomatis]